MPRSLMQISKSNKASIRPGNPAPTVASSKLGLASKGGQRGGGVKGSADALKR